MAKKFSDDKNKPIDLSPMVFGKVLPQATELEEAVLGAAMLDVDGIPTIMEILKVETFYMLQHQEIYSTMMELYGESKPVDILTVHEHLRKKGKLEAVGGVDYLMNLANKVGSAANIEYHARIIVQKYIQRELINISTKTIKDAFEDTMDVLEMLDSAEQSLFEITDQNLNTGFESISAVAAKVEKHIEMVSNQPDGLTGVTTGFPSLDQITNGWQAPDLIIIAARPGMGKTAFTLSLAKNAAEHGEGVAIFSLEMGNEQLVQRLIAMDSLIEAEKLRTGRMTENEFKMLHKAVENLSELPIYIDDTPGINIFELRAKCRRLKQNHNIKMIVIDYLQLMSGAPNKGRGVNREQEISTISRSLKGLAKELKVPVIALSQLSRAVETRGGNKRPQLSDLRESGAIEQDADIVTFIYRPEYYELADGIDVASDTAEIIISKHRNGALGSVNLRFKKECVLFTEDDSIGFRDIPGKDDFNDPFAGNSPFAITRPSKANRDFDEDTIDDL